MYAGGHPRGRGKVADIQLPADSPMDHTSLYAGGPLRGSGEKVDMTVDNKPVQNKAVNKPPTTVADIQLLADFPTDHMSAPNRGEHQPILHLETSMVKIYPNPLSPPKSTLMFYPMNSQKHGIALIINNKKLSEGSTYEMADCDELNLTEMLKFLGYHVLIEQTCSHDVMVNLFEDIEMQCLDPVMKSDSFICCILSRGDEKMVYGSDNKPVEFRKIQEAVKNCNILKKLPKLFFI